MSKSVLERSGFQIGGALSGEPVTGVRIQVVDDDPMIGTLLAAMLETMGHHVCAVSATEAAAIIDAARYEPGLMIVDAWLGDGSGVSAVAQILHTHCFIPHLFMSGNIAKVRLLRPDAVLLLSLIHI